jgi:peptide/nickel transport system permease protein
MAVRTPPGQGELAAEQGVINVIMALSIFYTPRFARVVRSVVLTIRELQYIEAARAINPF